MSWSGPEYLYLVLLLNQAKLPQVGAGVRARVRQRVAGAGAGGGVAGVEAGWSASMWALVGLCGVLAVLGAARKPSAA